MNEKDFELTEPTGPWIIEVKEKSKDNGYRAVMVDSATYLMYKELAHTTNRTIGGLVNEALKREIASAVVRGVK